MVSLRYSTPLPLYRILMSNVTPIAPGICEHCRTMKQYGIQVRLTTDLTHYHPGLVKNAQGVTVPAAGMWARGSDRFVSVRFEGAGVHDILWESLEIIDQEVNQELAKLRAERNEDLKTARNVVQTFGPRGGFRTLSYEYDSRHGGVNHISSANREEADELIELFKTYNIEVKVKRLS